jgi:hypothetical protein
MFNIFKEKRYNRYYFNVIKRDMNTHKLIKIVKMFPCYGFDDYSTKAKALSYINFKNLFKFSNKYYYKVEFDFE